MEEQVIEGGAATTEAVIQPQAPASPTSQFEAFFASNPSLTPEALTQAIERSAKLPELESRLATAIQPSNPVVARINDILANGTIDEAVNFLSFQKIDVANLSDYDAIEMAARLQHPGDADLLEARIALKLGLDGISDVQALGKNLSAIENPMLKLKAKDVANEARAFLGQQKVSAEMPDSLKAREAATESARNLEVSKSQIAATLVIPEGGGFETTPIPIEGVGDYVFQPSKIPDQLVQAARDHVSSHYAGQNAPAKEVSGAFETVLETLIWSDPEMRKQIVADLSAAVKEIFVKSKI